MIKRNNPGIFIVLLLVLALSGMATASAAAPEAPTRPSARPSPTRAG